MDFKVFRSLGFSLVSLVFVLIVLFIYDNKRKNKNLENIIFKVLLIVNVIGCIIEFAHVYSMWAHLSNPIMQLFCKLHAASVVVRVYLLMAYITTLRYQVTKKLLKRNIIYSILGFFGFLNFILIFFFDVELLFDQYIYDFSSSVNTYFVSVPYIICGLFLFSLFLDDGVVKRNQLAPLFYAVVVFFLTSLSQVIIGIDANFQNYLLTLLSIAFYFTTENQDVKLLEELEVKRKDADIANKAQTEFLANMSHEIRTPMNTIIGFAESLLSEKDLTEEIVKRDITEKLNTRGKRLYS